MSMRSKYPSNNESGFVTVLMVLLVGMAIAASAVGTAYYVNSAQKGLVSGHALTNAKSGAWTGVETFRQYLEGLNAAQINELNGQTGITLTAGSRTLKVKSLSVDTLGTTNPTYRVTAEIQNSSVAAKSSATVQVVYDVTLATSPSINPNPSKTITFAGGLNFYGNLNATGNINFTNSVGGIVLNVGGDFTSNGADGLAIVNVGGNANINENQFRKAGTQVFEGVVSVLPDKPVVNALDFEAMANYVFYVDGSGNPKVDVKNVSGNGLNDGTYALTDVGGFNGVVSYGGSNNWTLDGGANGSSISIAPGILLFKGSVELKKGIFANTILATENIDYSGNKNNLTLNAPNRAGAAVVCNSAFAMPTNLCKEDRTLRANAIGDIALLAGSCTDPSSVGSCSSDYAGGIISTAASSEVTGNIVAGNELDAGGRSMLRGAVLAAALSNAPNSGSNAGGNFTIDSSNSGGTTITMPGTGGGTGGGSTTTQTSQIKWARYL